jgi:hypothetical protein
VSLHIAHDRIGVALRSGGEAHAALTSALHGVGSGRDRDVGTKVDDWSWRRGGRLCQ